MKHGFLFWVSLLFVSVVMASFTMSSNCYALSYQTIVDYVNQTADFYNGNNYYQIIKTRINQPSMQSMLAQYAINYEAMYVYCGGTTSGMYVYLYTNPSGSLSDYGQGLIYIHGNAMIIYMDRYMNTPTIYMQPTNNVTQHMDTCYRTQANKYNELIGMNYSNYTYGNQILTYVGNGGYSPIQELEFENAIEDTGYNGNLFTYYYKGDFYSNNEIFLGDIIPNDSYYFEVRLKDSKTGVIKGTSYVALNTTPYTFYNDSAIYINENFEVYAIPRLLNYSTQYQLEITSYYGDGDTDLKEDIDWFIFLPYNAVVSGDNIISLGSGDFTQQDNANTIIGFLNDNGSPSGDLQAILDTSGNILSGDLFKDIKMPQIDGMNKRTLFDLLYAIAGTLGESGDAYFDFQLHGETPTRIYASQFKTPDGPLKTLISSFLVFLTFYFLLSQFRHTIEMLSTANVKGAIEYVDTSLDNMFYM